MPQCQPRLQHRRQFPPHPTPAQPPARPCAAPDKVRPGTQETLPYFVTALQANDPVVMSAAKKIKDNVLFCVVDR
jgi:hypothetical protein